MVHHLRTPANRDNPSEIIRAPLLYHRANKEGIVPYQSETAGAVTYFTAHDLFISCRKDIYAAFHGTLHRNFGAGQGISDRNRFIVYIIVERVIPRERFAVIDAELHKECFRLRSHSGYLCKFHNESP